MLATSHSLGRQERPTAKAVSNGTLPMNFHTNAGVNRLIRNGLGRHKAPHEHFSALELESIQAREKHTTSAGPSDGAGWHVSFFFPSKASDSDGCHLAALILSPLRV